MLDGGFRGCGTISVLDGGFRGGGTISMLDGGFRGSGTISMLGGGFRGCGSTLCSHSLMTAVKVCMWGGGGGGESKLPALFRCSSVA